MNETYQPRTFDIEEGRLGLAISADGLVRMTPPEQLFLTAQDCKDLGSVLYDLGTNLLPTDEDYYVLDGDGIVQGPFTNVDIAEFAAKCQRANQDPEEHYTTQVALGAVCSCDGGVLWGIHQDDTEECRVCDGTGIEMTELGPERANWDD